MLLGIALASALAWFYARYGHSLSNRAKFAQVLPLLTMITVLVISVVKSSLALSLGLVGALSIMRFRTAIKEPEELIYLFMALAIGLGLGCRSALADHPRGCAFPGICAGAGVSAAAPVEK